MRRTRAGRFLLLASLGSALLAGCVYYNGMYNTKRLARSAQRAEREGRTFEANNLWGQVITRAESLVTRHPQSKYVDEALVLQGVAFARLGQCPNAVGPLARTTLLPPDHDISETAALALGRCQMELGDPAAADLAFSRVIESPDTARRREARIYHARALRLSGRPVESLAALEGLRGPKVEDERLLALSDARKNTEALTLADSLITNGDSGSKGWDSMVIVMGRQNPAVASGLVDLLGRRTKQTPADHARRLVEDGFRLAPVDSARAIQRLREAAKLGVGTEPGDRAALRLIRQDLSQVREASQLPAFAQSLQAIGGRSSSVAGEASQLLLTVRRVLTVSDSATPMTPQSDLRLFLAAELARDSLATPGLAASLFKRIADGWPDSPYTPKALLAAQLLDPAWSDSANALLAERYSSSPYLAFLRGEESPGYRQLEDSLQAFALASVGVSPATAGRPGQPQPNRPVLLPRPGERPTPRRELEP